LGVRYKRAVETGRSGYAAQQATESLRHEGACSPQPDGCEKIWKVSGPSSETATGSQQELNAHLRLEALSRQELRRARKHIEG